MHVHVDREKCVAAGVCAMTAPRVFDQDEDIGTVVVLSESPNPDDHDLTHEAAALCPAQVITVTDG